MSSCVGHRDRYGLVRPAPALQLIGMELVHHPRLWRRYCCELEAVAKECGERPPQPPALEDFVLRPQDHVGRDSDIEAFLLHGCRKGQEQMLIEGFRPFLAGSSSGALFGVGCYLAENISKADLYAGSTPHGPVKGEVLTVVLVRTLLGQSEKLLQPCPGKRAPEKGFHSAWAPRRDEGGSVEHREYVLFDPSSMMTTAVMRYRHADRCCCCRCSV